MKNKTRKLLALAWASALSASAFGQADAREFPSQPYEWKNVVLNGGGFVCGYVFHPKEKNLVYCRTDMGGAYRRDMKDTTWVPILDWIDFEDFNPSGVESIGLDPNNPDKLIMACGLYTNPQNPQGEFLVSENRGKSYTRVPVPFKMGGNENGRGNGERLEIDPNNSQIVYFGSRRAGLWTSRNGGYKWQKVESFPDVEDTLERGDRTRFWTGGSGIIRIICNPKSAKDGASQELFAFVSLKNRDNVFRSTDGGKSWSPVKSLPSHLRPTQAELSADGNIYITYGDNPGPATMKTGEVWKYNLKTQKSENITPEMPSEKDPFGYASVSVDARSPKTIIVSTFHRSSEFGGDVIFRSTDGGKSWKSAFKNVEFDYSIAPYVAHTPVHWMFDIEIDPFNPDHVIFSTGYGGHECWNFRNADSGKLSTWQMASKGIEETVPLDIKSPSQGPQIYLGIGDYCGFAIDDLTQSPKHGCFTSPHFANCGSISYSTLSPNLVVASGIVSEHKEKTNAIGYSTDFGKTWTPCSKMPEPKAQFGTVSVSADGANWIWTPSWRKSYHTDNRGESWTEITTLPEGVRSVSDPVNPMKFYYYDIFEGLLYTSTDGGKSFSYEHIELPMGNPRKGFDRGQGFGGHDNVVCAPNREGDLWIPALEGLFHVKGNALERVVNITKINAFGFGKSKTEGGYPAMYLSGTISGVRGVFRSDDEGASWVKINDSEHGFGLVFHVVGDPKKYGRVYIGTHGRGTFYGDIK